MRSYDRNLETDRRVNYSRSIAIVALGYCCFYSLAAAAATTTSRESSTGNSISAIAPEKSKSNWNGLYNDSIALATRLDSIQSSGQRYPFWVGWRKLSDWGNALVQ
jgi:hypothetical protein